MEAVERALVPEALLLALLLMELVLSVAPVVFAQRESLLLQVSPLPVSFLRALLVVWFRWVAQRRLVLCLRQERRRLVQVQ